VNVVTATFSTNTRQTTKMSQRKKLRAIFGIANRFCTIAVVVTMWCIWEFDDNFRQKPLSNQQLFAGLTS